MEPIDSYLENLKSKYAQHVLRTSLPTNNLLLFIVTQVPTHSQVPTQPPTNEYLYKHTVSIAQ